MGIVAKGCDARSIVGLVQESQVKREAVLVIGSRLRRRRGRVPGAGRGALEVYGMRVAHAAAV